MKPATSVGKRANAIMLMLLLTAAMPSCQSEADKQDEELREGLRSMIGGIEKEQQAHLKAQRELVELHEKLKLKKRAYQAMTPIEKAKAELERIEEAYANGWQDEMRGKIDEASGEELLRVALKLRGIGERVNIGKNGTELEAKNMKWREANPGKKAWF